MDNVLQDIRYALRLCLRTPGFTAIAVLALALGIGANTAIFTIVNAVLLEPLPFRDPGRLVVDVGDQRAARRHGRTRSRPANFIRWRERATAFERMAPFYDYRINLTGSGAPEEIVGMDVTPDFFPTLGVAPMLGRAFAAEEGPQGHDAVADPQLRACGSAASPATPASSAARFNSTAAAITVVGVMPPDVRLFLKRWSLAGKPADLWMPFALHRGAAHAARPLHERDRAAEARRRLAGQAQAQMDTIAAG